MRTNATYGLLGAATVLMLGHAASAALVWENVNTPNADTLVLYHFDETSGTTINDSSGNGVNTTIPATPSLLASELTGHWLNGGAGNYLRSTVTAAATSAEGRLGNFVVNDIDWNKGLTASFWYRVRDEVGSPGGGNLFQIRDGTYVINLDTDAFGTSNNGRLRLTAGANTGTVSYGADHVWRHIGLVFDPAGNGGDASDGGTWTMYIDNVLAGNVVTDTRDYTLAALTSVTMALTDGPVDGSPYGTNQDHDELLIQNGVLTDFSDGMVPEPASAGVLALGALLLGGRRRQSR